MIRFAFGCSLVKSTTAVMIHMVDLGNETLFNFVHIVLASLRVE
jgi:hypothetical protein